MHPLLVEIGLFEPRLVRFRQCRRIAPLRPAVDDSTHINVLVVTALVQMLSPRAFFEDGTGSGPDTGILHTSFQCFEPGQ